MKSIVVYVRVRVSIVGICIDKYYTIAVGILCNTVRDYIPVFENCGLEFNCIVTFFKRIVNLRLTHILVVCEFQIEWFAVHDRHV